MRAAAAAAAADVVRRRAAGIVPRVGLVLATGLGALADGLDDRVEIPFADLPGFRPPTVDAGRLVLGRRFATPVAVLDGRTHVYEGATPEEIATPLRTLARLGCDSVILTCAAGSLNPAHRPGSLVALSDHLNLSGFDPLIADDDDDVARPRCGPRFPSLAEVYDPALRAGLVATAQDAGRFLDEGVYLGVTGPSFVTPAEVRAYRTLGADLVGVAVVPEAIVARHAGLKIAAVAVVTNPGGQSLTHERTLEVPADGAFGPRRGQAAERGGEELAAILARFLEDA
ncbi:MAG: purine-nucleoside phosphorylase [Solirubrobacteraceae bacterium]